MIRTVWVAVNLFVGTVLMGPVVIIAGLLRVRDHRIYDWIGGRWSGWILKATGARVKVEGMENVDPGSPQILVGNHQSWYDVWAVAASMRKRFNFVAKQELARIPVFGRAWKSAGHISIDRRDRSRAIASLDQARKQLNEEKSAIIMFAEGTRSPDDEMLPFKKGAFMLALHTGVPIVPFGVAGTRRVLPKGGWRVRSGPIILRFGKPIPTKDMAPADRDELMQRVRNEVRLLRDGARRELGPGGPETITDEP